MDGNGLAMVLLGACLLVGMGFWMGRGRQSVPISGSPQRPVQLYGTARVFRVLDRSGKKPQTLFAHRHFLQCWLIWRQFEKTGTGADYTIQFSDGSGEWFPCPTVSYHEPTGERVRTELIITQLFAA
jgi:hypothetical protein